ncbi:MAG: hypothetical protein AAGI22_23025 [Planctomycetota bacterium]
MPAGLKMSSEYGDAVNVVFVEVQGADDRKVERFALEKKWLGTNAMWTTERPLNVGLKGIPNFALLDSNCKVILKGYSNRLHGEIEELVAAEVEANRKGPKELPKSLGKAWKAFHKGDLAKGIALADKVAAKGGDDAEAATALASTLRERAAARVRRAGWMVENGYVVEADETIDDLMKALAGEDALVDQVMKLRTALDADDMKSEMDAAKQLAKVEAALFEDGLRARGADKKLARIAEKYAGTKSAARAAHLLDLLKG